MSSRPEDPLDRAPGFGECPRCPFLQTASAALCLRCAVRTFDPLPPADSRCVVCDGPLETGECRNPICSRFSRQFDWNRAVAMKTRQLEAKIKRLKYEGKTGWAKVLGRVLAGFLDANRDTFEPFDLITASPAFVTPERVHHTQAILRAAAPHLAAGPWEVDLEDPPAIVKTKATTPMVGKSWKQRHEIAVNELRPALSVPRRERTRGRAILVVDDVFTGGHTIDEVARALRTLGGASRVCGVTLARQGFRGPRSEARGVAS
jgi:predicted amidophosphoribosyltransferase